MSPSATGRSVIILGFLILFSGVRAVCAARPRVSAQLEEALQIQSIEGQSIPVIVRVRPGPARLALGAGVDEPASSKRVALGELEPLRADLNGKARPGSSTTTLWIARSVAVELPADSIVKVASRQDVEMVYLDRGVTLLPPRSPGHGASVWGPKSIGVGPVRGKAGLTGAGVRVGHIDTGVDGHHPDLAGRISSFLDLVNGRQSPYDDEGHGTHTAATIAGIGTEGVAPKANLLVIKALDCRGGSNLRTLLLAMQKMAEEPFKPSVVSCSWGMALEEMGDGRELLREAVTTWRRAGILPVFAVGNSGPGHLSVPGAYPETLSVGALGRDLREASFSSSGTMQWGSRKLKKPDVYAPGVDIVSARAGGGYVSLSGTSMACPHVAGLAALLKERRPDLSVDQLEQALRHAADGSTPGKPVHEKIVRLDCALDWIERHCRRLSFSPVSASQDPVEISVSR
jgi:subtilisin family serine protease